MGHESKCKHLHGHNYRIHFTVRPLAQLDSLGRVLDFSVINERLCQWLELNWDHKMLLYDRDFDYTTEMPYFKDAGIVQVPFNPTAENMALYLLKTIGPQQLKNMNCELVEVLVEETRKCSAKAKL